jgi:Putative prokaryotic signal transducing protein
VNYPFLEVKLVALTEALDDVEAEGLLELLRTNGIECWCRRADIAAGAWTGWACSGGPIDVLVGEQDLDAARELLPQRVTPAR